MTKFIVAVTVAVLSFTPSAEASFTFGSTPLNVSPAGTPVQVAVGDVDADGRNEVVVISGSSPSPEGPLTIYSVAPNGDATLEYTVPLMAAPGGMWSYAQPRIVDVDGDGDRDIALYLRSDGQHGILQLVKWDQSSSSFVVAGPYTMPESDSAYGFDMGDVTGDGIPDAITADHGLNAPQGIFVTSGASDFTSSASYPYPFSGIPGAFGPTQRGIIYVYARDLDADGRVDVAVSTAPYNNVAGRIFWNRPGLGLTTTQDLVGRASIDLGFGDQSNDGKIDVIANGDHVIDIKSYRGPQFTSTSTFKVASDPRTPIVGDLTGDGRPDIAVASTSTNTVTIIVAGSGGGATPVAGADLDAADFMSASYVQELTSGDVDNDGRLDLLFATDRVILIRPVPDAVPPVLSLPANRIVEATSPAGAKVTFTASATDAVDGSVTIQCTPPSTSQFPLGTTTVTCTADDYWDNVSTGTFTIKVVDTKPPVLTLPAPITVDATSAAGAIVTFAATATDIASGSLAVSCTPPSGSLFAPGTQLVQCNATDASGNSASGSFNVTVIAAADMVPPVLSLPADFTVEAMSASGAAATWTATANDANDGPVLVQCTPPSGSAFGLGVTTVNCSAQDAAGNGATGSFTVTVHDTTSPALSLPANIVTEATSPAGAAVSFAATAQDLVSGSVAVQCAPPSGSTFALGVTTVNCSAHDAANNGVSGSFTVTVRDTGAPVISAVTASPNVLGPPNHKMIPVVVSVSASDRGDAAPAARIVSVTSNEPVNGTGDGDTGPDWAITGPLTLTLRAERAGTGSGRIYTITVQVTDRFGNSSNATVQVTVRK